jgi:hypothetical protein
MKIDKLDAGDHSKNSDPKTPAKTLATGPRTEMGKLRSSRNAIKHGLFASSLVEGESLAEYRAFVRALRDDLGISGATAETLVEKLAVIFWRQARYYRAEVGEIRRAAQLNEHLKEVFRNSHSLGSGSAQNCQPDISRTEPSLTSPHESILISAEQLASFMMFENHLGREIDRVFDQLERVRRFKKLAPARLSPRKPSDSEVSALSGIAR